MAMEDEDNNSAVVATNTQTGIKKGGDVGDNGACIDRQPDTVLHRAGLNQTAGRGSRSGPGAHAATGIRVLKASQNDRMYLLVMQQGIQTRCSTIMSILCYMSRFSYIAVGDSNRAKCMRMKTHPCNIM